MNTEGLELAILNTLVSSGEYWWQIEDTDETTAKKHLTFLVWLLHANTQYQQLNIYYLLWALQQPYEADNIVTPAQWMGKLSNRSLSNLIVT